MNLNPNRYRRPKIPIVIPDRVAERAATRYVEDENGCHISTYSTASHGYAQIGWTDKDYRQVVTAHRAAWVYAAGEQIPDGMTIDHLCKVRPCVNPEHLRMMTNYENARRTAGRDWVEGQCVNGHSNEYLAWTDGGRRVKCSICVAEWRRAFYERKRNKAA